MTYLDYLRLGYLMAIVDNLVQQFGVRGERDVLLLYGRVYEGCLLLVALASTTVLSVLPVILLLPAKPERICPARTMCFSAVEVVLTFH